MTIHYIAPPCPACGGTMHRDAIRNCHSRFADIFICVPCGKREAFEQWFWQDRYETHSFELHTMQKGWADDKD